MSHTDETKTVPVTETVTETVTEPDDEAARLTALLDDSPSRPSAPTRSWPPWTLPA